MSSNRYRSSLALLWVVCFALSLMESLYLRWIVGIGSSVTSKLFELVISQYAPFMGAMLGFYFAAQTTAQPETKKQAIPYRLAMTMSGLWNLVMVGFVTEACIDSGRTEDAINDVRAIIPKLAWVVAPALGFFFGKPAGAREEQENDRKV